MNEPWAWEEKQWRGHVEAVRAGRSLTPSQWPGGATVAVAISFDSDHETVSLRDQELSPGRLSQGEYGARRGVGRILELLREFQIPATFFMPAVAALLRPWEVEAYVADGHELALHGWIHERNQLLEPSVEKELTWRASETLARLSGRVPVGMRTPSWDFSGATMEIISSLGLLYDSSLMADNEPYEIEVHGEPTGIVEIPVEWIRDDAPYFVNDRYSAVRPHSMPRDVATMWLDEFDLARREGGVFQLTLHPHIIGHRSRIAALSELFAQISEKSDVWFCTHEQLARVCRDGLENGSSSG